MSNTATVRARRKTRERKGDWKKKVSCSGRENEGKKSRNLPNPKLVGITEGIIVAQRTRPGWLTVQGDLIA